MSDQVLIDRQDDVLTLTLNRPDKGNALNEPLVEALIAVLEALEPATRLVVVRGIGRHFCTGFDLDDLDSISDGDLLRRFIRIEALLQWMFHAPVPLLALAHGRVVGAGADIFCAASNRLAAPGTMFQMPGWRFGIALGTRRLAQRVGREIARAILLESRILDADAALSIGLAQRLVPTEKFRDAIAEITTSVHLLTKQATAGIHSLTLEDTRDADMAALVETASRPGLKERIQAYRREVQRSRR